MKTYEDLAKESVKRIEWAVYIRSYANVVLWIDKRILKQLGQTLPDGQDGVGPELFAHFVKLRDHLEPGSQLEFFLRNEHGPTCTVFWANIAGNIYASAEPMFPFPCDN
jgi:hypothetical protein